MDGTPSRSSPLPDADITDQKQNIRKKLFELTFCDVGLGEVSFALIVGFSHWLTTSRLANSLFGTLLILNHRQRIVRKQPQLMGILGFFIKNYCQPADIRSEKEFDVKSC